ncbi:MAG TPA: hypothetical protein VK636_10545 [Gemmatimonadaceae bacterium]|nr:hypothetical protein [Gemmatimonadaceae bacterium]
MTAMPPQADTVTSGDRTSATEQTELLFQSLPPLESPGYLALLKTATAGELPASVLARAYRRLQVGSVADATLDRLVFQRNRHGYLNALYKAARQRRLRLGAYGVEDLEQNAIGEIVLTLAGQRGQRAERYWVGFLHDCVSQAYRGLVGRREQRLEARVDGTPEEWESEIEPARSIPWQGCVMPDRLERLEGFIARTIARIPKPRLREVAADLFSHSPTQVSSKDVNDPNTLAGRLGVNPSTIHRLQDQARAILRAALEAQNEFEVDTSCLKAAKRTPGHTSRSIQ